MEVLLVNPSWDGLVSKRGRRYNRAWPPLDLLYGAALAEQEGAHVTLLDARAKPASPDEIARAASAADIIVLTSSPLDRWQCPNLDLDVFKEFLAPLPKNRLYVTGVHGTAYPEQMLEISGGRGVLTGDPEFAMRDLFRGRPLGEIPGLVWTDNGDVVKNTPSESVEMNDLPTPAYHLLKPSLYGYELFGERFTLLEATRGCPFSCSYCSLLMYGRKVRFRDPKKVGDDVQAAVEKGGARCGYFIDLEFTVRRKWVLEVCEELERRALDFKWCVQTRADTVDLEMLKAMKSAGCALVHYGVESGSPEMVEAINKGMDLEEVEQGIRWTKEAGMESACFFMFGFPEETVGQMEQTIRFSQKLNPTYASFHVATPYPGAPWYPSSGAPPGLPYAESFPGSLPKPTLVKMARKGTRRGRNPSQGSPARTGPRALRPPAGASRAPKRERPRERPRRPAPPRAQAPKPPEAAEKLIRWRFLAVPGACT